MRKRMKKTTRFLTVALIVALLTVFMGTGSVAQANPAVSQQVAFVVDGSGSIGATEWNLMVDGLASAIEDPNTLPHNGTVELWVIQFAGSTATLEVDATVIDSLATAQAVGTDIRNITKRGGFTPTGEGIKLACQEIAADMDAGARQFINLITNGHPEPDAEVQKAIDERNACVSAGIDEIDAEAIGVVPVWLEWLRAEIVYPGPGVVAPPYPDPPGSQGWVRPVADFDEFAEAIRDKFERLFLDLTLAPPEATNDLGEEHTVTATYSVGGVAQQGVEVNFEVTSGPHAGTSGSGITGPTGEATFSYVGNTAGTDTIVASVDTDADGVGDLFSNEVTKTWQDGPAPPIPGVSLWSSLLGVAALIGLGIILVRRRRASYQQ